MSEIYGDSAIAAARKDSDTLLKTVLSALDPDDFSSDLSAFRPFTHSVKLLFYEEAAELLNASADQAVFERDVRGLCDRILDEYTKRPATQRLTKRRRNRLERPMPLDKQLRIEPRDKWDIFAPVLFLPNKKDMVRRELRCILGGELAYWLREGASRFSGQLHSRNDPPTPSKQLQIPGPYDSELRIFPHGEFYLFTIWNGSLGSIEQLRLEIVSARK